jgi:hypothetical protein
LISAEKCGIQGAEVKDEALKEVLREQRARMIRSVASSLASWAAEEKKANEMAAELAAIWAGSRPMPGFVSALDTYQTWARDAGKHRKRAAQQLKKLRARRI